MWYRLHGYDVEDPPTKQSGIGHSRVLDPALRMPPQAWLMARKLTIKAASRLRRELKFATRLDLSLSTTDDRYWADHQKLSPMQDNFSFLKILENLWLKMLDEARPKKLLRVSVYLSGLCRADEITPDLFDISSETYQHLHARRDNLTAAMDKINKRFGADVVTLGVVPETQAGYVGTKISFTRVPELEEFSE
jgi:DNA polymerase-4